MWNYRIVKNKGKDAGYSIRETYYNSKKQVCGMTVDAIDPFGDSPDELIVVLKQMLKDAKKCKNDILVEGEIKFGKWAEECDEEER